MAASEDTKATKEGDDPIGLHGPHVRLGKATSSFPAWRRREGSGGVAAPNSPPSLPPSPGGKSRIPP